MPVSPQGTPLPAEQSAPVKARPRVVIIGSGFGRCSRRRRCDVRRSTSRSSPRLITTCSSRCSTKWQPASCPKARSPQHKGCPQTSPQHRGGARRSHRHRCRRRTVTSVVGELEVRTRYDSLIVAAGAGQSYFGHPEFEEGAGLKSIDDALELRGRIFGSFEVAELLPRPGPGTLADLRGRRCRCHGCGTGRPDPRTVEACLEEQLSPNRPCCGQGDPARRWRRRTLSAFGDKQSTHARSTLERMGIEVRLGALVTDVDETGVRLKFADGREERIEARCKIWAAGVTASPLAAQLAERTGAETDRSGRVKCLPDLTLPGHPEISVVGDMVALNDYPGSRRWRCRGVSMRRDASNTNSRARK